MTLEHLVIELRKFPSDSLVYPYEGEITGIIVVSASSKKASEDREMLGYISFCEEVVTTEEAAVVY